MLPVAVIKPAVPMLPILALPVAVIKPTVPMLPILAFPDTERETNVPVDVMFGCAAVVTVPAVVALVAAPLNVPVNVVAVTLPNVPLPVALTAPAVTKLPPVILPVAVIKPVVPMFPILAFPLALTVVVNTALLNVTPDAFDVTDCDPNFILVPERYKSLKALVELPKSYVTFALGVILPVTLIFPAFVLPLTLRLASVPVLVILG